MKRQDIVNLVSGIGIELGVAEGVFAEQLLRMNKLTHLYGVDSYCDDGHSDDQYQRALTRLLPYNHTLIRMKFDQALALFPNNHFDFIYIDGFAWTGEEEGQTLRDWFPKAKVGGIFAGDDYHSDWPKVRYEIDKFSSRYDLKLHVVEFDDYKYPTWYVRKYK